MSATTPSTASSADVFCHVRAGDYRDSGALMRVARAMEQRPGVRAAAAVMGTPKNLELLRASSLLPSFSEAPAPGDLLLLVRATREEAAREALAHGAELLDARSAGHDAQPAGALAPGAPAGPPRTLSEALAAQPDARVALLSVPGAFAAREARAALELGLHVFLFSNGVAVDDEVALKALARERGLVVLGPDCGTALLDGLPLGFANAVRPGPVGVIGASGTGIQELTCLLDRAGLGLTQAYGTGGRDLSDAVGGATTLAALERLATDSATRALALVSKPPSLAVARAVLARAAATGRPVVAALLGLRDDEARALEGPGVHVATTLEAAARALVRLFGASDEAFATTPSEPEARPRERSARGHLRGLFTGGTLAYETLCVLRGALRVTSNLKLDGVDRIDALDALREDPHPGHLVLDLGEEEFTQGRPHPMIDPRTRGDAIALAARDEATGVLLLNLVLGDGAAADPTGPLVEALARAQQTRAAMRCAPLELFASVTGTEADPQPRAAQVRALRAAGVRVYPSAASAARAVLDAYGVATPRPTAEPSASALALPPASAPDAEAPRDALGVRAGVLNVGLESLADALRARGVRTTQVAWRPPARGDERLARLLDRLR